MTNYKVGAEKGCAYVRPENSPRPIRFCKNHWELWGEEISQEVAEEICGIDVVKTCKTIYNSYKRNSNLK